MIESDASVRIVRHLQSFLSERVDACDKVTEFWLDCVT